MVSEPFIIPHIYFHRVTDDDPHYTSMRREVFTGFLDVIAKEYRTIRVDEAVNYYFKKITPNEKTLLLSFDDGYLDLLDFAVPKLIEKGLTATFFVVTDYIGKKSTWREDGTSVELFTATDLRTLISSGFDVQLHGASHCSLDKSSNSLIENETFGAAAALEDLLGRKVSAFAYPFGRFDENSRRIINERFDVGFSTVKSTEIDWRWRNDAIRRTYIPPNCDYEHVLSLLEAYRNSSDAEFIEMYS